MGDKRFRVKRHYSIVAHSPDVVELRYGVWNPVSFTLTDSTGSGHLFNLVAGLDGSRSSTELAAKEQVSIEDVEGVLDQLLQLGVVESEAANCLDHYLDDIVPGLAGTAGQRDETLGVRLLGDPVLCGQVGTYINQSLPEVKLVMARAEDPAVRLLADPDTSWLMNGLRFQEQAPLFEAWRGSLLVVMLKTINPAQLRTLNRVALEHRITWMHAAIDGPVLLVGPVFIPHRTACYECLETRVTMNLRESASYQQYKRAIVNGQIKHGPLPIEPVLGGLLASHTAFEVLNFLLTGNSYTVGKVLAIYLPTMEFSFNEVLRVPGCSACGPSPERDDQELYFDLRTFLEPEAVRR
jgi:bacteriocin biosynthesis cyclodehydratase domain-containing protein